jgi:hypothetical protein
VVDPLVIHADLTLFLTTYIRARLAERPEEYCQGVEVGNREIEPPAPTPQRQVVVRDDSGPDTSIVTAERTVGISVMAGTLVKDAVDLALMVQALVKSCAGIELGNPVAAVTGSLGPYAVPDAGVHARQYFTVDMIVVATPL